MITMQEETPVLSLLSLQDSGKTENRGGFIYPSIGRRLLVGWMIGTLTSVVGVTASYAWDLPTGATIVCTFGAVLVLIAVLRFCIRPPSGS